MNNGYQKSNGCGADKEGGKFLILFSILNFNRSTSARLLLTVSAMSSGGFRTTHYQNTTNDNRKHKR